MPLELSKVPLIPPDPTTLPVGGRLGYFHFNCKFLGACPSVIKTLEVGLQLPIGSVRIPLSRVPLISSQYSSLEKNLVLCDAVVDMLLKGAIQVRDSSSLAFYSRLFLVAKKTGGWRPVIDTSHLNLYLDFPTFRMETTQSETPFKLASGQRLWTSRMHTSTFSWLLRFTNCSGFKSWASCTSLWLCLLA